MPFPKTGIPNQVKAHRTFFQLELYHRFHNADVTPWSRRDLRGLSVAEIGQANSTAQGAHGIAIKIMTEARVCARTRKPLAKPKGDWQKERMST
jgi:hypothetical protein